MDEDYTPTPLTLNTFLILPTVMLIILLIFLLCICYRYRFAIWYICHVLIRRWKLQRLENSQDSYLYDALVCFSSSDSEWVWKELRGKLESGPEAYSLCLHDRDFPLGAEVIECIDKSLSASRKVLVILSNAFLQSPKCKFQLDLFVAHEHLARAMPIIIILGPLDESLVASYIKRLIDTCPFITIQNPKQSITTRQWSRLKAALGPSLSRQ